jgi:hypothetical protein
MSLNQSQVVPAAAEETCRPYYLPNSETVLVVRLIVRKTE